MIKNIFLIILLCLQFHQAKSQKTFKSVLKQFKQISLPSNIDYTEMELYSDTTAVYLSETLSDSITIAQENDTILEEHTFEVGVIPKELNLEITDLLYFKKLKDKTTSALIKYSRDTSSLAFFPLNLVFESSMLYVLTIEAQYVDNTVGTTVSEKYVVTFGKSGKLISWLKIAEFTYQTSAIGGNYYVRIPVFNNTSASISKDLTITLSDPDVEKLKYKILDNGSIIPL